MEFDTDSPSYSASDSVEMTDELSERSHVVSQERATATYQRPPRIVMACVTAVIAAASLSSRAFTPDIKIGAFADLAANQQSGSYLNATQELLSKIRDLGRLSADWNGPGTRPAEDAAIEKALSIITSLPRGVLLPRIGTAGDGEVSIVWDLPGYFADVGVQGNGSIDYYVRDQSGKKHFGDDIDFDQSLPVELIALLPRSNT